MGLMGLKWLLIAIIFTTSVASGFASLHIANRYKKLLAMGEALANGIFVGAAFFHLIPDAAAELDIIQAGSPFLYVILMATLSFLLLFAFEKIITHNIHTYRKIVYVGPLLLTLSVHAFITGLALGISNSLALILSVFIAIMAHKAFEMFALVINLHKRISQHHHIRILFFIFSFVTPLGILLGMYGDQYLPVANNTLAIAIINAACAGTFIYIATVHAKHRHHPHGDGYERYEQILATIAGVIAMGILAIWI